MGELTIQKHSFDLAKNRLKEFSEKTEAELAIEKVKTNGRFFGLGDHKVTGNELNARLETIQANFIAVNTTNDKIIKEFREVYNALDILDKDYITSIVANVKAIKKTSNDVRIQQGTLKQHNEKLSTQQHKLDAHQIEIEKTVSNVSKIVEKLKIFKENLEAFKHLKDIDKTWNDCKTIQNEIQIISDNITQLSKDITKDIADTNNKNNAKFEKINKDIFIILNELTSFRESLSALAERISQTADSLIEQIPIIEETALFIRHLKDITHLDDVDNMWDSLQIVKENIKATEDHIKEHSENIKNHQSELNILSTSISEQKQSIDSIHEKISETEEYTKTLSSLNHLMDVDELWENVGHHTSQLSESKKRDEDIIAIVQENKEAMEKLIADTAQTANDTAKSLTKKISRAYWIAGGSVALAAIELILLLTKVI